MAKKIITAAERYRSVVAQKEAVIVDVTAPSGFVFKFEKPSAVGMVFTLGEFLNAPAAQPTQKMIEAMIGLRDKVIELSREPKLVIGPATNDNEISTGDLSNDDLGYLFQWVAAGGGRK